MEKEEEAAMTGEPRNLVTIFPDGTRQERKLSPDEQRELDDQFLRDWNPETMRTRAFEKYLSTGHREIWEYLRYQQN